MKEKKHVVILDISEYRLSWISHAYNKTNWWCKLEKFC